MKPELPLNPRTKKAVSTLAIKAGPDAVNYVQEVKREIEAAKNLEINRLKTKIDTQAAEIQRLETTISQRIDNLEAAMTGDDKYALTREKIVRLMKEMGIE